MHTERLELRKVTETYIQALLLASKEELFEMFNTSHEQQIQMETARYNRVAKMQVEEYALWNMHLLDGGHYIGNIGIHSIKVNHKKGEIGYYTNAEYRNKGYMAEAAMKVVRYGFDVLGLHRISACVAPDNIPSQKVIKRLGFQKEGLLRQDYIVDGVATDSEIYGLLASDFGS